MRRSRFRSSSTTRSTRRATGSSTIVAPITIRTRASGFRRSTFRAGDHPDYHEVTDEPQYIDYDAMARVATYVRDLALALANLDHRVVVDHPKQKDPHAACVQ